MRRIFLGSVTVKKCLARPTNVLWSHRGSLRFMELDSSAAIVIWGKGGKCYNNQYQGFINAHSNVGILFEVQGRSKTFSSAVNKREQEWQRLINMQS